VWRAGWPAYGSDRIGLLTTWRFLRGSKEPSLIVLHFFLFF